MKTKKYFSMARYRYIIEIITWAYARISIFLVLVGKEHYSFPF